MITIKDLAKELDVSAATISKALNDREDISKELKEKVKKTAHDMGYSPNTIAQKLVSGKTKTIGLFILRREEVPIKESFAMYLLEGITEKAYDYNYDIILINSKLSLQNRSYIDVFKEKMIDGAIFINLTLDDPGIKNINNSNIPVAVIDQNIEGKNIGFISTDNIKGISLGLNHLYNFGHRKIAFVSACNKSEVSNIRKEAYIDFMQNNEIYNKSYIFEGDFSIRSGYETGKKIINLSNRPTAIFAASDSIALGLIKAFKENNIKIPEDISVIGFDNINLANSSNPSLTTIGQKTNEIGKMAVNYILKKINKEKINNSIYIEPELIIRQSTTQVPVTS